MQGVRDLAAPVQRDESLFLHLREIDGPQRRQYLLIGIPVLHILFERAVKEKGQETCEKVRPDPAFDLRSVRAGRKIRFHDPETFPDLPAAFADFQDIPDVIIREVCADGIETVVLRFRRDRLLVQTVPDLHRFSVFGLRLFPQEPGGIVRIMPLPFDFTAGKKFLGPFDLPGPDILLVCRKPGGVCDDQTPAARIRAAGFFFIIELIVVRRELRDVHRPVVRDPAETLFAQGPGPVIRGHLSQRLRDDGGLLALMLEDADISGSEAGVAAPDQLPAAGFLQHLFLQRI